MTDLNKQRRNALMLIVIGSTLSILVGVLLFRFVRQAAGAWGDPSQIVVAAVDIPARTTITSAMLTTREVPSRMLDEGMYTSIDDLLRDDVAPTVDILKDGIIMRNMIASNFGLQLGQRAVSIEVSREASVGNNVRPGNQVDLLLSYTQYEDNAQLLTELRDYLLTTGSVYTQEIQREMWRELQAMQNSVGDSNQITSMLVENVSVLAVNNRLPDTEFSAQPLFAAAAGDDRPTAIKDTIVTLAVEPTQALQLVYASQFGDIHLVLRRADEPEAPPIDPIIDFFDVK